MHHSCPDVRERDVGDKWRTATWRTADPISRAAVIMPPLPKSSGRRLWPGGRRGPCDSEASSFARPVEPPCRRGCWAHTLGLSQSDSWEASETPVVRRTCRSRVGMYTHRRCTYSEMSQKRLPVMSCTNLAPILQRCCWLKPVRSVLVRCCSEDTWPGDPRWSGPRIDLGKCRRQGYPPACQLDGRVATASGKFCTRGYCM